MELLSRDEVEIGLADPIDQADLDALLFLRDLYYLVDEGFIEIEGDRVYPVTP